MYYTQLMKSIQRVFEIFLIIDLELEVINSLASLNTVLNVISVIDQIKTKFFYKSGQHDDEAVLRINY